MKLVGYSDRLSVQPGQNIAFMISSELSAYKARVINLIHGDDRQGSAGFKFREVKTDIEKEYVGVFQPLKSGSYLASEKPLKIGGAFCIEFWTWPTTLDDRQRVLLSQQGPSGANFVLFFQDGYLTFEAAGQIVRLPARCQEHIWCRVSVAYNPVSKTVTLSADPRTINGTHGMCEIEADCSFEHAGVEGRIVIGATSAADGYTGFFNGKIENPIVRIGDKVLARWDFADGIDTWSVVDVSGNGNNLVAINQPTRAVTGHNWDGSETSWRHARHQYAAIHFHDDDLGDAGWSKSLEWAVPAELKSGVYALHVFGDREQEEDYIPFFVRPKIGAPTAKIAVLLPTFSYLAYGNERILHSHEFPINFQYPVQPNDAYVISNRLLSLYDKHSDGSGVCYSSRLRPLVNMRPKVVMQFLDHGKGSPHALNADLYLIDWLHEFGFDYDVITDEDLHHEGAGLLKGYNLVITATHNEYWSIEMVNAAQTYLQKGGRLFNLSGNGMYWVTQLDPETGSSVEIRRRGPATRIWEAQPGEAHLSATGELGGIWRYRGYAPQTWLGSGFTAETPGSGQPYIRQPDSFNPKVGFIFEGIGADELIGDFPNLIQQYGAAGYEFDRVDFALGSPSNTLVLATASGFSDDAQAVSEEILLSDSLQSGSVNPKVRCDMAYVEYPKGGAVLTVGSITWCGALSYNNYRNTVSRLTENVVRAFSSDTRALT